MTQRDGFGGGFLAGAIFGGVVGGILGALITSRQSMDWIESEESQLTPNPDQHGRTSQKRRQVITADESENMELARRSLEDKIAQLNATIDEVRQQLGNVSPHDRHGQSDRTLSRDS